VSITSRVNISSHFRFLPKSVLFGNLEYGHNDFKDDPMEYPANSDSDGLNVSVGLRSQFSRKFGAEISVGTTMLWFQTGPDDYGITGGGGVTYQTSRTFSVALHYEHSDQISTFTNYHKDDRIDFTGKWRFARKMEFRFENRFAWLDYSGPIELDNGELRRDFLTQSILKVIYSFRRWLDFGMAYQLDYRDSNATNLTLGVSTADFLKHQVTGIVSFYY
jgi:hypothetical protein